MTEGQGQGNEGFTSQAVPLQQTCHATTRKFAGSRVLSPTLETAGAWGPHTVSARLARLTYRLGRGSHDSTFMGALHVSPQVIFSM